MSTQANALHQLIQWLNEYFAFHAAAGRCQDHDARRKMITDGRPDAKPEAVARVMRAAPRECVTAGADAAHYRPLLNRVQAALVGGPFCKLCPVPPLTSAETQELNKLETAAAKKTSAKSIARRAYLHEKRHLHGLYLDNWLKAVPPVQADFNVLLQMRDDFELRFSTPPRPASVTHPPAIAAPTAPVHPLTSWDDILTALNENMTQKVWKNTRETKRDIRRLNDEHGGPIYFPNKRGKPPSVNKAALMAWWNGLGDVFERLKEEAAAAAESARLTAGETYRHGGATVAPGVGGSVKPSRAVARKKTKADERNRS